MKFQLNRVDAPWDYPALGFRADTPDAILDGSLFDPEITSVDQLDAFWTVYVGGSAQTGITLIPDTDGNPPVPAYPTDGSLPVHRRSTGGFDFLTPAEWLADPEIEPALSAAIDTRVPTASTTAQGKVELATDAEAITGTDTARAVTPAAARAAYVPRTIPDTAQIISKFLGDGQVFWTDHDDLPIFSIPAAGGPRSFGDFMGAWCGVFDKAIEFTPWGSLRVGDSTKKQLFLCTNTPLDAETVAQMDLMDTGGHDAKAKVGDLCLSLLDPRTIWRCLTAGTAGTPEGTWTPVTVGSSIKTITNHSATSAVQTYEELLYCWNTITLTLPNPSTVVHGREFTVKNAGVGTVTVVPHAGSIIDGAASKALTANQYARFVGITSAWILV